VVQSKDATFSVGKKKGKGPVVVFIWGEERDIKKNTLLLGGHRENMPGTMPTTTGPWESDRRGRGEALYVEKNSNVLTWCKQ